MATRLYPFSSATRARAITVFATVAVTLVVVLAVLNITTGEKPVRKHVEHLYAVADPQFQRTLGVLLGPDILPGNRFEVLLNGEPWPRGEAVVATASAPLPDGSVAIRLFALFVPTPN